MNTFTIIVICLFVSLMISFILFANDIWEDFMFGLGQLLCIAFMIALIVWVGLFMRKLHLKNHGSNYDYLDNSILEIKSIINYGDSGFVAKDNIYYTDLINRIEKYNEYINDERNDYKFFNVTPTDKFLSYQKMIYNYNNNTVTWEDGITIVIENKED